MSLVPTLFLVVSSTFLLLAQRNLAMLPLLFGACYLPMDEGVSIGPFTFTLLRILIAVGFMRKFARGESIAGGIQTIDYIILLWGFWCIVSGLFRPDLGSALVFRMGRAYNVLGTYFLVRTFCYDVEAIKGLCKALCIIIVPIGLEMVLEQIRGKNLFSLLGGVGEFPNIRDGRLRAQGPFRHAILAGTVGASCLPFMFACWNSHRKTAIIGSLACCCMVFASVSSGPIMTLLAATAAACIWLRPRWAKVARWSAIITYFAAEIIMERPAYYIISMIDLTGSSTAYFRSRLIDSSIIHLNEWWLAGTDYTRHWMPTGVSWNPNHTDITNQYLAYGVWGGLLLMGLFVLVLIWAFIYVSRITSDAKFPDDGKFLSWMLGAALFSHVITFVSVSYYDQSYVFVYVTLGAIGSMYASFRENHVQ